MEILHKNIHNNIAVLLRAGYVRETAKALAIYLGTKIIVNIFDNVSYYRFSILDGGLGSVVRFRKTQKKIQDATKLIVSL